MQQIDFKMLNIFRKYKQQLLVRVNKNVNNEIYSPNPIFLKTK